MSGLRYLVFADDAQIYVNMQGRIRWRQHERNRARFTHRELVVAEQWGRRMGYKITSERIKDDEA